jgi:hypothetical protein
MRGPHVTVQEVQSHEVADWVCFVFVCSSFRPEPDPFVGFLPRQCRMPDGLLMYRAGRFRPDRRVQHWPVPQSNAANITRRASSRRFK